VTLALAVACVALGSAPDPVLAHPSNPNFVSVVHGITPSVAGIRVAMLGGDDRLLIRDPGHHTVVVMGYDGEPYARLLPDGAAQVNVRSPATYLNQDRLARVTVPARADASAPPVWTAYTDTGQLDWHDHRSHWMGAETPPQVTDVARRTKIFDYRVPIRIDGRPAAITGTLFWVGRPGSADGGLLSWVPVSCAAVGILAALSPLVVGRRRRRSRRAVGKAPRKDAW
jgi:hypothetical protein